MVEEAVFLGGSRRVARLPSNVKIRLDELIARHLWMYVGDANGADRALQQHLADRAYERVKVYAVRGMLRNNVGRWSVCSVDPPPGARGFDLYSVKDVQMTNAASYGLMLWDGKSRGTLENVRRLLTQEKPVALYLAPARRFISLKSTDDLRKIGVGSPRESRDQTGFHFGAHTTAGTETAPRTTARSQDDALKEIFSAIGQALEAIQCIEMDLVSLYVVDAVRSGNSSLREEAIQMADAWDAKTFGSLVRPLLDSPHIPSDMKRFLEGLRHQRNHLVHRYFKDKGAQLHTAEGRRTAEEELRRLLRDLRLCRDVVHSSAIDLATEVGVTEAMIAAEYDKMHARLIQR